ncbi:glycosyl hydrolase 53 family protein [Streptomyces indiaensis]|uniref:Arabinogalactan endo-beta-1,4-galactanase n=1 Tax=Streptomyces indiaensis TaxID=284033 RepID=A0ABN3E855_9ACTN|nr:hypothetical protein [Streptomyces indiaensis]
MTAHGSSPARLRRLPPESPDLGVFSWEAIWTAVGGNGCDPTDAASGNARENQALFGHDGRPQSSMPWFRHR